MREETVESLVKIVDLYPEVRLFANEETIRIIDDYFYPQCGDLSYTTIVFIKHTKISELNFIRGHVVWALVDIDGIVSIKVD